MQTRRIRSERRRQAPIETLVPEPRHSNNEWRNERAPRYRGLDKAAAAGDLNEAIGAQTWLVWGSWNTTETTSAIVYRFPTATDCLLWYRWCLLGIADEMEAQEAEENAEPSDEILEYDKELILLADDMRAILDNTTPKSDSSSLLAEIEEDAVFFYGNFLLHGWESIHDYLSRTGAVEFWRETLNDDTVQQSDGQWHLAPEGWQKLHDWFGQHAFDEG